MSKQHKKNQRIAATDDQAIVDAGYTPQLSRRLGFWSSFGISFSFMSAVTGIYANYGFVLKSAGPFGLWTWILVAIGQSLVALVFAEMAGRIPLTGCSYNWNCKLANPTVGWFAGWMALMAYVVGVAAVTTTIFPILQHFGISASSTTLHVIGLGLILAQAFINIYGIRASSFLNLFAVFAEVAVLCFFGLLLAGVWLMHGFPDVPVLTIIPSSPQPYWPAFLLGSLLAGWTLIGFEGAADVSEETINVRVVTPRGILRSIAVCATFGFAFIFFLTLAIPDAGMEAVTAAADPVTMIITTHFGTTLAGVFLALVLVSVLACSLVTMTGASRVLFAMSRDGRFIGSRWLSQVSKQRVPRNAIWSAALVAGFFLLISDTATALYGSGTVLFALFYLVTVVNYGLSSLPATNNFSLGRFHTPVVILAVLWLILEIGILTVPAQFHLVAVVTGGIILIGCVLYAIVVYTLQPSHPSQSLGDGR